MDPIRINVDERVFQDDADWLEFYGDVKEEDPPDMPEPLGNMVRITAFMDSDHAGNRVTRRFHSGIFIFVNNALITTYSKKQNTVEAATFGAEMVAMRIARDLTVALRIKIRPPILIPDVNRFIFRLRDLGGLRRPLSLLKIRHFHTDRCDSILIPIKDIEILIHTPALLRSIGQSTNIFDLHETDRVGCITTCTCCIEGLDETLDILFREGCEVRNPSQTLGCDESVETSSVGHTTLDECHL